MGRVPLAIHSRITLLSAVLERFGVRRASFFGSVLRDDFTPDSDVDILVEFEPDRTPGLAFFTLQDQLSLSLGRSVDLETPAFISGYFRDDVLRSSVEFYVAPG
jgi:predicted nucleotidyltransferase